MKQKAGLLTKITRTKLFLLAITALSLCGLVIFISLFMQANHNLRNSIQRERIDYVSEISDQIISSRQFMEDEYTNAVISYAGILTNNPITEIEDARLCLSGQDAHTIMLASTYGGMIDLNGKSIYLSNRQLLVELSASKDVVRMFTSLGGVGDCWLFAKRIEPLTVDGKEYDAVILAIPASEFSDNLAISLFDNRGASYIIKSDGGIDIKPNNVNNAFTGFNLFAGMTSMGAPDAQVEALEAAVKARASGSMLIAIKSEEWLISYDTISEHNAIIVAVPLAITAANTYSGLNDTIVFASVSVLLAALLCLIVIVYFLYRDRERNRKIMAAEAKSDFFSKMSHDIRTPLNAIIGLETLAKDSDDISIIKGYLAQSTSAASYLLSIINDVLDMSRINSGKLSITNEPFDLNTLIADTVSMVASMAAEKDINFTREGITSADTYYMGDPVRLRQVLVNLLSNSVKYTEENGSIWLTIKRRAIGGARDELTFYVRDSGIGMSKQFLSRVFTPFEQEQSSFTAQYTGSGLGLSIVHSLVKLMGGDIEVKSQQGKGTVFTVTVPLTRCDKPKAQETVKGDSMNFAGKRILLAEDNEINKKIAVMLLKKKFDIDVDSAPDGAEAIRMFELAPPGYYNMILMDVKMPNMDGLEATRRIRALDREDAKRIPIVALSANAFAEDVRLSLEAGMNTHLSKPLDVAALTVTLKKYLC